MKRFIARLFGLHTAEEIERLQHRVRDLEMIEDLKANATDAWKETIWGRQKVYPRFHDDTEPARPLPWHPFHPEPLKNPETLLRGHQDTQVVRAIMQLLEGEAQSEHEVMLTGSTENLPRSAGAVEALLDFHTMIERLVKQGPPDKSTDV